MLKDDCCHPEFARDGDKCTLCDKVMIEGYDLVLTTHVWRLNRTNYDSPQLTNKTRLVPDYPSIRRYAGLRDKRVLLIMPKPLTKDEQRMFEFAQGYQFEVLEV